MPPREPSEQTDGKLIRKRTAELLIFFAQDGITNIGTHLKDNTIWPTQELLAKLYDATRENVAQHLQKSMTPPALTRYEQRSPAVYYKGAT